MTSFQFTGRLLYSKSSTAAIDHNPYITINSAHLKQVFWLRLRFLAKDSGAKALRDRPLSPRNTNYRQIFQSIP